MWELKSNLKCLLTSSPLSRRCCCRNDSQHALPGYPGAVSSIPEVTFFVAVLPDRKISWKPVSVMSEFIGSDILQMRISRAGGQLIRSWFTSAGLLLPRDVSACSLLPISLVGEEYAQPFESLPNALFHAFGRASLQQKSAAVPEMKR